MVFSLGGNERVRGESIGISPARVEKTITQDDRSFVITVSNPGEEGRNFVVHTRGMSQSPDGGAIFEEEGEEGPWSAAKLMKVEPKEFYLAPKTSQKINVKVEIPKERSGGAYGVIIVSPKPLETRPESGIVPGIEMQYQVGSLVLLTFLESQKGLVRNGEVKGIDIVQDKPEGEIKILTRFHNTGNIHLRPGGNVLIREKSGKEIANVLIEPATILPDYSRPLRAVWKPKELPVGKYTAESKVKISESQVGIAKTDFTVIHPLVIAQPKGEIADFSTGMAIQNKPIPFRLLFHNRGNIESTPRGDIEIKDTKGKIITKIPVETKNVIPNSSQQLGAVCQGGLLAGEYIAIAKISYYEEKLVTAETRFVVLEKEIVLSGEITEFAVSSVKSGETIFPQLFFKNSGNITSYVEGIIELQNSQGKTVGQITIGRVIIPPGKTKRLEAAWQGKLPLGLYQAKATLILGGEKFISNETSFLITK